MDAATAAILTNEARRQELRAKIALLKGQMQATSSLSTALTGMNGDAAQRLSSAQGELAALEQGAGPGVTGDFGPFSATDQALRAERFAGKAAWVDYVKANPACIEADALPAYTAAALKARPADRQWLLHDATALRQEYSASLVRAGLIPDTTWASWRAWILATPRDVILGLS